jgi:predicted MFS family arabinose efflux permease
MKGSYAPRYTLFILMLTYSCNVMDRNILTMVLEPIRHEFALSDTQLGLLSGLSFAIFYAVAGLPLGLAADRLNRRNLIFVCLTLWSGMTALCGMAGSFVQLLVARIGVGVGEAGGGPPATAMISDLFSAKRRATAISTFYLASPLGSLVSFAGGGWLAQHYGWRTAFYAAGVPGLILAAVLILTVREPPRGLSDVKSEGAPAAAHKPTLREILRYVASQRSLLHLIAGTTLTVFVVSGVGTWSASFFIRTHGFTPAAIGSFLGTAMVTGGLVGTLAGGAAVDWLGRRDDRWRCWVLALAALITAPLIALSVLTPGGTAAAGFYAAYIMFSFAWYGPVHGLCQTLVELRMRAMVSAIVNLISNLLGVGLGSQVIGLLSDRLAPSLGAESLRYAMLAACAFSLWAALHFWLAGRSVRGDLVRARMAIAG